jgi:hypothetical protein
MALVLEHKVCVLRFVGTLAIFFLGDALFGEKDTSLLPLLVIIPFLIPLPFIEGASFYCIGYGFRGLLDEYLENYIRKIDLKERNLMFTHEEELAQRGIHQVVLTRSPHKGIFPPLDFWYPWVLPYGALSFWVIGLSFVYFFFPSTQLASIALTFRSYLLSLYPLLLLPLLYWYIHGRKVAWKFTHKSIDTYLRSHGFSDNDRRQILLFAAQSGWVKGD